LPAGREPTLFPRESIYDNGTNVGIGTSAPNEKLDVNGRIYIADSSAPSPTTNRLYAVSGNLYWNGVNLTGGGALPSGTTGQTLYNNSGAWTATSNLFNNGTNIGIGTTAPAGLLDVGGGKLTVLSGGNVGIGTTAPVSLFDINAKFNVLSSGNVGIGTTNPLAKLTIFGTDNALRLAYDDSNYSTLSVDSSGILSLASSNTGDSSLILGNGLAQDTSVIFDGSSQDYYLGLDDTDGFLKIGSGQVVGTGTMLTITSGGNLGIGTETASQKLSLAGTFGIIETGSSPTYYTIFQGGDQSANITYTLPTAQGIANYVLRNDGSGNLSWSQIVAASVSNNALDYAQFENTMDLDANLTLNQTTYTWTQNFTGTTTTGLTYNANSLTTGTAVSLASTSTAGSASSSTKMLSITRSGANANASHTGNVTAGTYNGITITSGTGTLTLNSKTLTLNNSLAFSGADGKTINFGSNNLTFSTSGDYTLTIPATGTAALGTGATNYLARWTGTNSLSTGVNL
jgi:hypothetical protein